MSTLQRSINVLLPVRANAAEAIRNIIDTTNWQTALATIDTLHFFTLALLPTRTDDDDQQAMRLLVEANFDGDQTQLLAALWESLAIPMQDLLAHCEVQAPLDLKPFATLMEQYDLGQGTAHIALPGMDLAYIRGSVHLFHTAMSAAQSIDDPALSAADICKQIASDTQVRNAILKTPTQWPGERLRRLAPKFAFVFSLLLTFCILASTNLRPLLQFDYTLEIALVLDITLALALIALFASQGALSILYRLTALCVAILALLAFHKLGILTLPLYSAAILLALLAAFWLALARIPATESLEQFIEPIIIVSALFPVVLLGIRTLGAGTPAMAADVALLLVAIAALFALATVPIIPLMRMDKRAILYALLLFLLLPIPVSPTIQTIAVIFLLVLASLLCALFLMLCRLQRQELGDPEAPPIWEPGPRRDAIAAFESTRANSHNHLLSVTVMKPGLLRRIAMRCVLLNVRLLSSLYGTRGELSGIVTIHFARWLIVEKEQAQLIFISNYCGNWASYLDEFIDQASGGLTSIWCNTVGFPRSAWLQQGGAALAERFKLYARRSQIPSLYHYSAYPTLTVDQIEKYMRLNQLLSKEHRSDEESEELLRFL